MDASEGMLGRKLVHEEPGEIEELVGVVFDAETAGAVGKRDGGAAITAGRTANAKVDAAGMKRLQHTEGLGDFEWAVVAEHDAAGADADAFGASGDFGDQDLGRGGREAAGAVMFGEPVAFVAELVGEFREFQRLSDGLGGVPPWRTGD